MQKKGIILDRDGVINYDSPHYIKSVEEFIFIPGSLEAIARLTAAGFCIGVATNQSGVSRALYTEDTLKSIHQKMLDEVKILGGRIDAIEYCIHLPSAHCECRKPKPSMLIKLAKALQIPEVHLSFVGDRLSDIEAAKAAGMSPIMILSSMTDREGLKQYHHVPIYESLNDYVTQLLL